MDSARNYIFGYGSLQNMESINNTISCDMQICDNAPTVRVKNLKRGWYMKMNKDNMISEPWTTLACIDKEGFTTNGMLFEITPECLEKLDEREVGYIRKQIQVHQIECICNSVSISTDSVVYYYSIDESDIATPSTSAPILQSYLDICLTGCIAIDMKLGNTRYEYTVEFIQNTYDWRDMLYWINDRIYPRRPYEHVPFARIIDAILCEYLLM